MTRRNGNGVWEGNLKEGTGKVKVGERRFRRSLFFCFPLEKGRGIKPGELLGAPHAVLMKTTPNGGGLVRRPQGNTFLIHHWN